MQSFYFSQPHGTRIDRAVRLAPTTRAIRAALAASIAALALAGSGAAVAGSCVDTTPNTVSCNGDFADTLPGSIFTPVDDLTLVLGDSAPTSVTPAVGAMGVDATWGGHVAVTSHADITTTDANGIHVYGSTSATLGNYGNVTTKGADAVDISAHGDVSVVNAGGLLAYASGVQDLTTLDATSSNGNVSISNRAGGTITANAAGRDINAVYALAQHGTVEVNNAGTIAVDSYGSADNPLARGIRAQANDGDTTVTNSGTINVQTTGSPPQSAFGAGIDAYAHDDVTVGNSGRIAVSTTALPGFSGGSYGIYVRTGNGQIAIVNSGDIADTAVGYNYRSIAPGPYPVFEAVHNFGIYARDSIAVTGAGSASAVSIANSGNIAIDGGAYAEGIVAKISALSNAAVINTGMLTVNGPYVATGISIFSEGDLPKIKPYQTLGDDSVTNAKSGSIIVSAQSGRRASATGIEETRFNIGPDISQGTGITVDNAGLVSATAVGAGGFAYARGVIASNFTLTPPGQFAGDGYVHVSNSGAILASATAPFVAGIHDAGLAQATGIDVLGNDVIVDLGASSTVDAVATAGIGGYGGSATGLSVSGIHVLIDNAGAVKAQFNGAAGGKAFGVVANYGDVTLNNSGTIAADSTGNAIGVDIAPGEHGGKATLVNSGSITASSTSGNSYAVFSEFSDTTIQNLGTLDGAVSIVAAGDTALTNGAGGRWNAVGKSYFGGYHNEIVNAGTIDLHDSAIAMSPHTHDNTFSNSGTISVDGENNLIDLGPSKPGAFTNTGIIEFRNGSPGDALAIAGNLAGNGRIGVDASAVHGTRDMLQVFGNVAAGSVTAVDVNLLDLPTAAQVSIPLVTVTGDATASNFVLGQVHFDQTKGFMDVTPSLLNNIDASNVNRDVFSLGLAVTGVTDSGALAASIVPGVQSLVNSEIGTWRDRMGVLDPTPRGKVGAWARAFQDSGTVNPGHVAGNFGPGGNFAFDQTNSGEEIGADFAISDSLSAGLLLGKVQASQHLDGAGIGRDSISGDTRGAYATWNAAGGFYADASYRSLRFDARLHAQAGELRTTGKAEAINLELGQAWTIGDGYKLVPQLQYTRTAVRNVDALTGALSGFTPRGGDSSRGRAGLALSRDIPGSGNTVWTPYASASAVHEFDGANGFTIDNNFSGTTDTKGSSALIEGGVSVKTGRFEMFGSVNWQDGGALKSFAGGQIGLHCNW